MSTDDFEAVYLDDKELLFLLEAAHRKTWYGLPISKDAIVSMSPDNKQIQKSIFEVIASLYQKGILERNDGGKAFPIPPWDEIIRIFGECQYLMNIYIAETEFCEEVIYPLYGKAISLKRSFTDESRFRFVMYDTEGLIDHLFEVGLIPRVVFFDNSLSTGFRDKYSSKGKLPENPFLYFDEAEVTGVVDICRISDGILHERQVFRDLGTYGTVEIINNKNSKIVPLQRGISLLPWIEGTNMEKKEQVEDDTG